MFSLGLMVREIIKYTGRIFFFFCVEEKGKKDSKKKLVRAGSIKTMLHLCAERIE